VTRYAQTRVPFARSTGGDVMRGVYTCPELGETCQRPGAYDAFRLPSVYGNRLHYPDGRVVERDPAGAHLFPAHQGS
jgi:hypothetical protein